MWRAKGGAGATPRGQEPPRAGRTRQPTKFAGSSSLGAHPPHLPLSPMDSPGGPAPGPTPPAPPPLASLFSGEVLDIERIAARPLYDVTDLLEVLNLGHYAGVFEAEKLDLATIFFLEDHALISLGFSLSERIRFHRCLQLFKDMPPPPNRKTQAAISSPKSMPPVPPAIVPAELKRPSMQAKIKVPFTPPEATSALIVSVFDYEVSNSPLPVSADYRPEDRLLEALTKGYLKLKPENIVCLVDENATTLNVEEAIMNLSTEFAIVYLCGRCFPDQGVFMTFDSIEGDPSTGLRLSSMRDTSLSPDRALFIVEGPNSSLFGEDVKSKGCGAVVTSSSEPDFVPFVLTQTFINVLMGETFTSADESRVTLTSVVRSAQDVLKKFGRKPSLFYPGGLASAVLGQAKPASHPLLGSLTLMQADSVDNKMRLGVVVAVDEQLAQARFFFDGSENWKDMSSEMRAPVDSDFVIVPLDANDVGAGVDEDQASQLGRESGEAEDAENLENEEETGVPAQEEEENREEEGEEEEEEAAPEEGEEEDAVPEYDDDEASEADHRQDEAGEEEVDEDEEPIQEEEARHDDDANAARVGDDDEKETNPFGNMDEPPGHASASEQEFKPSAEQEAVYARMRKMGLPEEAIEHRVKADWLKAQSNGVPEPEL